MEHTGEIRICPALLSTQTGPRRITTLDRSPRAPSVISSMKHGMTIRQRLLSYARQKVASASHDVAITTSPSEKYRAANGNPALLPTPRHMMQVGYALDVCRHQPSRPPHAKPPPTVCVLHHLPRHETCSVRSGGVSCEESSRYGPRGVSLVLLCEVLMIHSQPVRTWRDVTAHA